MEMLIPKRLILLYLLLFESLGNDGAIVIEKKILCKNPGIKLLWP